MVTWVYLFSLEFRSFYFQHAWYPITRVSPSIDRCVRLGGITAPYHAHRLGNDHLPSSTPFVEDFFPSLGLYTSVHPHWGGSGCVNVGSISYILFMSYCSPYCFLWVQFSWLFLPISYSLDSLLTILGCFGLIWLSCRIHFLCTLSEVSTRSCLSQVLRLCWNIG